MTTRILRYFTIPYIRHFLLTGVIVCFAACDEEENNQKYVIDNGIKHQLILKSGEFKSVETIEGRFVITNFRDSVFSQYFDQAGPYGFRLRGSDGRNYIEFPSRRTNPLSALILAHNENFNFPIFFPPEALKIKSVPPGHYTIEAFLLDRISPVITMPLVITGK